MPQQKPQKAPLSKLGEFGLINRLRKQMGPVSPTVCGIGDDAAVAPVTPRRELLFTADMLVEGVHFAKTASPKSIGHKAMASSISDIAAMGGKAKYALISLGIPKTCSPQFVDALYKGIKGTAQKYHVAVVGGDTVLSPKIIINVALSGEAKKADVVYRHGAKIGDHIFVTGPLGKSLATGRHLRFIPRIDQAEFLVKKFKPTSMIDISDGLAADLGHILKESRVGAIIEERLIPGNAKARLKNILYDGEDFELLFTLSPQKAQRINRQKSTRHKFYFIGTIIPQKGGLTLKYADGTIRPIQPKGYAHF